MLIGVERCVYSRQAKVSSYGFPNETQRSHSIERSISFDRIGFGYLTFIGFDIWTVRRLLSLGLPW